MRPFVNEKFESRVAFGEPDDCWLWTGPTQKSGHGLYSCPTVGTRLIVSRVAFEWYHQREIAPGLQVRHTCDTPNCVNPAHLIEGTHKDNMRDMKERKRAASRVNGRHCSLLHPESVPSGEQSGMSKLTWKKVAEIRRLREDGMTIVKIAERFGVSHPLISQICLGRIWVSKT